MAGRQPPDPPLPTTKDRGVGQLSPKNSWRQWAAGREDGAVRSSVTVWYRVRLV